MIYMQKEVYCHGFEVAILNSNTFLRVSKRKHEHFQTNERIQLLHDFQIHHNEMVNNGNSID